jgi:hypothetical protein
MHGDVERWSTYHPARVASVHRDGLVAAVELADGTRLAARDFSGFAEVLLTDQPADPILAALGDVSWRSLDEARAAVRGAMP